MLDKKDLTLGLAVLTGRARSAAKALSIVAQDMTRHRLPGDDPNVLSLRIEEDQMQAFQYLVDNVLTLTREAAEVVDALAKGTKADADMPPIAITRTASRKSDEDDLPRSVGSRRSE